MCHSLLGPSGRIGLGLTGCSIHVHICRLSMEYLLAMFAGENDDDAFPKVLDKKANSNQ